MSANVYSIETLLEGMSYRSRRVEGIVLSAEKRDDVWYDNAQAYLIRVRPSHGFRDTYATIAVALPE